MKESGTMCLGQSPCELSRQYAHPSQAASTRVASKQYCISPKSSLLLCFYALLLLYAVCLLL